MTTSILSSNISLRWLQRALFVTGDVGWLLAWSVALGVWLSSPDGAPILDLPTITAVTLAAMVLTRVAIGRQPVRFFRLGVGTTGLLVALAIADGVVGKAPWASDGGAAWASAAGSTLGWRILAAVTLAVAAWWRGIVAGRSSLTVDTVESGFRGAIGALVGLFLIAVLTGSSNTLPAATLIWLAMVVLFAGLLGMPLARILQVATTGRQNGEIPLRISRQWVFLLLGTIGTLLVVAILLASVLTFERLDRILGPLASGIGFVLGVVVYLIALPLGYVVEWLVYLIRSLIHPTDHPQPPRPIGGDLLEGLRKQTGSSADQSGLLARLITVVIVVCLAALILWILSRAVVRSVDNSADGEVEETRESVWSWSDIWNALLRWLDGRRRRRPSRAAAGSPRELSPSSLGARPLTPRELYRELLRIGARAGRRRMLDETANDYQKALAELPVISPRISQVDVLTRVYVQDRYAPDPPDEASVDAARAALDQIREIDGTPLPSGPPPSKIASSPTEH